MKKVNCVITLVLLFVSFTLAAQQITIEGTITDSSGEPVIGASIVVRGTTNGAISDYNGQYKLTVKVGDTVEYSYIGFRSHQEVIKDSRTVYNVVLQDDANMLSESIVVAYGTTAKSIVTGSVASIYSSLYDYGTGRIDYDKLREEEYNKFGENRFKSVRDEPISTFSSDVDKASYSNMRRFLNQNTYPDPDAIRTEELVNYFHYDYGQPTDEHPILINGEIGKCPWNPSNLLCRIGIKTKDIPTEDLPPSNFVFLIDVSGSMYGPTRLGLVKSSLNLLVDNMQPHDKIAIVVYAGSAGLVLPSTSGEQKEVIKEALNRLEAGGSTAGGDGIKLAYKVARKNFIPGGNNRIILCTDGDFNVGVSSNKELEKLIEEERDSGVFLTVLGYGMGNYKDSKLQTLAQKGNGNHAYIDSEEEANRVLVIEAAGTLYLVAKDVKIQVEFNPDKVARYRLIGYETRLLENEDFDDDLKDAGDMGSGHTVTAFYEIVPAKGAKLEKKDEIPWLTFNMRYKHPESDTSQLLSIPVLNNRQANSSDFHFASAVVMFSQLLRNSEFKGKSSYKYVLNLAQGNIGTDEHGYRGEFLELVKKAQKVPKTVVKKRPEKPVRNPLYGAPEFHYSDFESFYEDVKGEEKTGMKDEKGKIIVPAEYDDVEYLIGGVFLVENDDKYGLYHHSKGLIVPLIYDDIDDDLIDGYLSVEINDKYGVIDIKGREVVPVQYEDVEEEYGFFVVEKNDKYGLYTQTGKQVIPVIYDDVEIDDYTGFIIVEKEDKYGWYSMDGTKLSETIYDDEPDRFANNYFLVSKDDKEGLIDVDGKIIIPCKYEDIDDLTPNIFVVETEKDKMGVYSGITGKRILKEVYDDIDLLDVPDEWEDEGYLELEKNDLYGVASPQGKIILSCKYDDVDIVEYEENGKVTDFFFIVEKNVKYGLISKTGKVIIPVRYDDLDDEFEDGLIEAEKGDKTYYFNRSGKIVKKK